MACCMLFRGDVVPKVIEQRALQAAAWRRLSVGCERGHRADQNAAHNSVCRLVSDRLQSDFRLGGGVLYFSRF